MKREVLVEISARHLHISQSDFAIIYGKQSLTPYKELSQPGQYAAEEQVVLKGLKGQIDGVRILGPFRRQTQVEISKTDAYRLGVDAPLRLSGDLKGSAKITIIGPKGRIDLNSGLIIAQRHLHISSSKAKEWAFKHGQKVSVRIGDGDKGNIKDIVLEETVVRVSENFKLSCHIDTDEANAANINKSTIGIIINE